MFNKYPYTDFHELNLDWIITKMKELESDYSGLVSGYEQIEADFRVLQAEVNNLLNTMEADIRAAINEYLPQAMAPYIQDLNDALAEIERMKAEIAGWDDQLYLIRSEYSTADDNLQIDYINRINELRYDMLGEILRLDYRIDHIMDDLPDIHNPVRGYQTNIAQVIYDVYDACRYFAYTVKQFDAAGLTAQELDDMQRIAIDLDLNGYFILYPPHKCLNPLTGERADICTILQDLALFASTRTWTALIWDGTWDQDATTIDALDLTSFDFDYSDAAQP